MKTNNLFAEQSDAERLAAVGAAIGPENPALLCAVDEKGRPRLHWIAAVSLEFLPALFAVVPASDRKLREIRDHGEVAWVLACPETGLRVVLNGTAEVRHGEAVVRSVYRRLPAATREDFISHHFAGCELAVIETTVETAEFFRVSEGKMQTTMSSIGMASHPREESFEDRSVLGGQRIHLAPYPPASEA